MKICATIKLKNNLHAPEMAEKIVTALSPDNMSNMKTHISKNEVVIKVNSEKITSLIATMDDLLMNAKLAEEILEKLNDNKKNY